jgi:FtsP/CotA-like multicopper oxidase with cupredoxin domain
MNISVAGTVVANVVADTTIGPNQTVGPYSNGATGTTWSASRPAYLRDLRGVTSVEQRTVGMGARTINGTKFMMDVPTFTIPTGKVQQWTIKGATNHPFHLHVYHMQMDGACGAFEDGEYYDTIAASPCDVRFDLNPATSTVYDGGTVMHCHILDHEDQGATKSSASFVLDLPGTRTPATPTLVHVGAQDQHVRAPLIRRRR